eukprot:5418754-Alexandrium_andersonii.AAC.1
MAPRGPPEVDDLELGLGLRGGLRERGLAWTALAPGFDLVARGPGHNDGKPSIDPGPTGNRVGPPCWKDQGLLD